MKSWKTLLFIGAVIAMLAGLCAIFPRDGVKLFGKELHFASLTKVLAPEKQVDLDSLMAAQQIVMQELSGLQDSVNFYKSKMESSDIRFWYPNGDDSYFDDFLARCESAKADNAVVRIMHYGDSQIEMDRMSSRLRRYMQRQFGGGGPGMVYARTIIGSYSITQWARGGLTLQTCFGADSLSRISRANGNYGPMVQCFHLGGDAQLSFKAPSNAYADDLVKQYSTIGVLFCNRPGPLSASVSGNTDEQQCSDGGVHLFKWQLPEPSGNVNISLNGSADIYGVMLDNGPGVAVDNIPMRGCSGQQFSMINRDQLASAYSQINVGLIIMQFGGNSVPYLNAPAGIAAYCKQIGAQIDRLHQCAPKAKILFVGPSDMSTTINGEMQSYPSIERVINSLRDTATAHGAAFWSIYQAMGGFNSMIAWNSKGWAGADYIHFSQRGADIMGDKLADAFDQLYIYYKMRSKLAAKNAKNKSLDHEITAKK